MTTTLSARPLRVVLVLKTNHGCMWVAPHVDALLARGHEVVAVLPPGEGRLRRELARRAVSVVDSPFDFGFRPGFRTLAGLFELRRTLAGLEPDVLHYHLFASALAVRLAGAALGAARVHMVPGPLHLESRLIRVVERFLARMDTVTICGSRFTARRYRALGRPAAKTPVIPYGVDTCHFRPVGPAERAVARARLGVEGRDFVVIMVALVYAPKALVHRGRGLKGHEVLLAAWRRFHAEHPDSRLVLVGGGFDEAGASHRRELVAEFRLDEDRSVTWVDTVDDVRPYYGAADLSVSPSLSDNHGAALEAGAMGVPSVVSDAGALQEAVDTAACWVVRADDPDALVTALHEAWAEHRAGRLADRAEVARDRVVRQFDSAPAAAAVAEVVERAAGRGRRLISVFTETRSGGDHRAYARYLVNGDRLCLVTRAEELVSEAARPLPDYHGPVALVRTLPRLALAIVREVLRAEVVVLRQPGPIGWIAAVACKLLRRRYSVEVVGDPFDVLVSGTLGRAGRSCARLARAQMRWVVRGATAVSYVTGSALQQRYPAAWGRRTAGVSDVRIDAGALRAGPREWSPAPFGVIAVGSHEQRYKGHDVLLRAVRRLVAEGLDVNVVLVGGGRRHDELVALAGKLGLADRAHFTGPVFDRARVTALLDSAHLFALPSRAEGMPRALIEAMARALPAVGTCVGGIPELLGPGSLVAPDDDEALAGVMRRLLTDPVEWERQSLRNLDVARTYDSSLLDERFSTWLAQVPAARPRRRSA
ncbi:glycosyltransferase [Lentzea tibetensis]|uniref:Glycosyltransferase n=1 Tax=Lentzea tibetensis TaxID=2591470 RepID=A0A563EXX5_9PSEU|nr:glycosyltransferase [Lentzea tibetensis]TWP52412.1 glycosyltransferase [Lentzea tibetensis]